MHLQVTEAANQTSLADPCSFSPNPAHAERLARYYAQMFSRGGTVADIGSGQGFFLEAARAAGLRPIGLDRDASLVEAARRRGYEAIEGDVLAIAEHIPSGSLDGVMASHIIEHLTPSHVRQFFAMLADAVRPGGDVIVATPNMRDLRVATYWFWLDVTHVRPYPAAALGALIDPLSWEWVAHGYEPAQLTRRTPGVLLNRLRFGREYGRAGCWYHIRRT